jgi:hypothetical protein
VHSYHSSDCFSSIEDIIKNAINKKINVLAITDHNVIKLTHKEEYFFRRAGIHYIQGCELTSKDGAHIIGLFINSSILNVEKHPCDIVDQICHSGGTVLIPHPFTHGSGIASVYSNNKEILDYILTKATLIELYNGAHNSHEDLLKIRQLADQYNLKLVATSDAHKPWHVGNSFTEFSFNSSAPQNIYSFIIDKSLKLVPSFISQQKNLSKKFRKVILFRNKIKFYSIFIKFVPVRVKRNIKKIFYFIERYYWRWILLDEK